MINENKKQNIIIICLIGLIVLVAILIGVLLMNNNSNKSPNTEEEKTEEITKEEIKIEDYQYLIDNLYKSVFVRFNDYANGITSDAMLYTAIDNISEYDEKTGQLNDLTYEEVKASADKIFGVNAKINFEKNLIGIEYVKSKKIYTFFGVGAGLVPSKLEKITNIEKKDNKLFIYTAVGLDDYLAEEIHNDYINGKKIYSYDKDGEQATDKYDVQKYFEENIDKFAKYKYTFELENNNYIYVSLEKVK